MKFHCDRCKTRYSISDERVRGKILKIRCKNCSAVITVREGMASPAGAKQRSAVKQGAAARAGAAKAGAAKAGAAKPGAAKPGAASGPARAREGPKVPRIITPRPSSEPSQTREKRESLEGAFKKAISSPDASPSDSMQSVGPPGYDVEWYVSIDGDQQGPLSLLEAQQWVSARDFDDELFCWSEGFDDWLPVEQVSELSGLRDVDDDDDAFDDERTVVGAPPDFSNPMSPPLTTPSAPSPMTYPAAAAPVPEPAPPAIPIAAAAASPRAGLPAPGARPTLPEPVPRPGGPVASGSPSPVRSHNTPTPQPLFAATLEQVEANAPTGIVEPGAPGQNGKNNELIQMPPAQDPDARGGDLELDIGEASRVVKLPHLAQMALQGNAAADGAGALPGVGGQKLGTGTGPQGSVSNRTGPAMGIPNFGPEAPRPELLLPKRRAGLLPMIIGAGIVLAGVIGLLVFLAVREDEVDEPITRDTTQHSTDDLGKTYTAEVEPRSKKGTGDGAKIDRDVKAAKGTKSSRGSKSSRQPKTGTTGRTRSGGADEVDLGSGSRDKVVQGHLDPSVVSWAYNKYGSTLQRCFESALKKDPFLKAPKALVAIQVAPDGRVTRVNIPALHGKYLGNCLVGAIKRWRFQKSTKGLTTKFPVVFKS